MRFALFLKYILFFFLLIAYGISIGKYEVFPYSYLKKFQDKFDPLIYPPEPQVSYKNKLIIGDEKYEYILNTSFFHGFKPELEYIEDIEKDIISSNKFFSDETAFIVMDPWPTNEKKEYIIENKIIPLIELAAKKNHMTFILTTDPMYELNPNHLIHKDLEGMLGKNIFLVYHNDFRSESFSEYLFLNNIKTLIYLGFDSNACIIDRDLGIVKMKLSGFRTFFIPGASAAHENINSNKFHTEATKMIKRYWGSEIKYQELIVILNNL